MRGEESVGGREVEEDMLDWLIGWDWVRESFSLTRPVAGRRGTYFRV